MPTCELNERNDVAFSCSQHALAFSLSRHLALFADYLHCLQEDRIRSASFSLKAIWQLYRAEAYIHRSAAKMGEEAAT